MTLKRFFLFILCAVLAVLMMPPQLHAQSLDTSFNPGADADVVALAVQTDGKLLVGGHFNTIGGVFRQKLARLLPDGTPDASFPNPLVIGTVQAIGIQKDEKIVIGGSISQVGGKSRSNLARLLPHGSLDTQFATSVNGDVYSIYIQPDGKIIIGGTFTSVNGSPRNRIARINPNGSVDTGFNPNINGSVRSIAMDSQGRILVGGNFSSASGATRLYLARFALDGTLDASFAPEFDNWINAIAVEKNDTILVGGIFDTVWGFEQRRLVRILPTGAVDGSFQPSVPGVVNSIVIQTDGKFLIGGYFSNAPAPGSSGVIRFNPSHPFNDSYAVSVNNPVRGLALQANGKVLVGGELPPLAGEGRQNIGRLNASSTPTSSLVSTGFTTLKWNRSGTSPELTRVFFERWNGLAWINVVEGTRVIGGWEGSSLTFGGTRNIIRARGTSAGGVGNASTISDQATIFIGNGRLAVEAPAGTLATNNNTILALPPAKLWPFSNSGDVILHNTGGANLTGFSWFISGPDADDFLTETAPPSSLTPLGKFILGIRISSQTPGSKIAILSIQSSDSTASPFNIYLSGYVLPAAPAADPPQLALSRLPLGYYRLTTKTAPHKQWILETSSDLWDWQPKDDLWADSEGILDYLDKPSVVPRLFYRLASPPDDV